MPRPAVIRMVTDISAPAEVCFDLARSIDLHVESMIASKERAVAGVMSGLISGGEEVSWEARHFGLLWHMTSRITEYEPPRRFVDQMVRGPFSSFRHEHLFAEFHGTTRMTDFLQFRMPVGLVMNLPTKVYLRRLMTMRNAVIRTRAQG